MTSTKSNTLSTQECHIAVGIYAHLINDLFSQQKRKKMKRINSSGFTVRCKEVIAQNYKANQKRKSSASTKKMPNSVAKLKLISH